MTDYYNNGEEEWEMMNGGLKHLVSYFLPVFFFFFFYYYFTNN